MGVGFRGVGFRGSLGSGFGVANVGFGVAGFGSTVCMQMKPKACAELGSGCQDPAHHIDHHEAK